MSAALVIFTRELRDRSRLLIGCAVLAAVPFLATLLPSARGNAHDVVAIVGGFLAACIGLGLSVASGGSVLSRDLAERRMSFYFGKPIRPAALWLGKAGGSLLTCLLCFAVIAVPAMLFAGPAWKVRWLGGIGPLALGALAIAVLFFVSHGIATVTRSHSALLMLDFVFAIIAAGALLLILWPVILGQALGVLQTLAIVIASAVLVVLAIAPVWQLEHGRADIRRSHAAFSRFFWPAVAVVLLVAGGYVWWLISATPRNLTEALLVEQPPRGTKIVAAGTARGRGDYRATFLIDRATGRYERIAPVWWGLESSADGRVLAWLQPAGLFSLRFLEIYANGRGTGIMLSPSARFVLSDDGTRVATDTGTTVSVYELATGRLLMSAAGFDAHRQAALFFPSRDVVRVIETSPLRIAELDVRTRRMTRSVPRDLDTPRNSTAVSADGSRMLVTKVNLIVDGRTGATIAALPPQVFAPAAMLSDGSVAGVVYENGPHLRLFGPDGRLLHDIPMPREQHVYIGGEIEGGKLFLVSQGGNTYVIDVARGAVVRRLDGVRGAWIHTSADPRLIRYGANQELVGSNAKGELVLWKHEGRAEARPLLQSR